MKILHTADWHLGKKLYTKERLAEQETVLEEIHLIAEKEKVDLILMAGDIYDIPNPSNEAIELFYRMIRKMTKKGKRPIIAIAGNHDSPDRIEAPDPLARSCGIVLAGYPYSEIPTGKLEGRVQITQTDKGFIELTIPKQPAVRIIHTSYANEYRMKSFFGDDEEKALADQLKKHWKKLAENYCDANGINIMLAHLFVWPGSGEIPEEPDGEKPINIGNASLIPASCFPAQIQYVALGHLHRPHFVQGNEPIIAYSGSPLAYSFSESNQQKSVNIIDIEAGFQPVVTLKPLKNAKKLYRKKVQSIDEAKQWLADNLDAYVELSIYSEDYIQADELKSLHDIHPNLLQVIPLIDQDKLDKNHQSDIDLSKSIEEHFDDYFEFKNGQKPNDTLKSLFKEILSI